jgi:hypothetical protein
MIKQEPGRESFNIAPASFGPREFRLGQNGFNAVNGKKVETFF